MLIISAHPPLANSKEAGQKVFYNFVRQLQTEFELHLITFIRDDEKSWGFSDVEMYFKTIETVRNSSSTKAINIMKNPFKPILLNTRKSPTFSFKIKEILSKYEFDAVHFEWEQMLQYLDLVKKIKFKTVTCHDVISQMYDRKYQHSALLKFFYKYQERVILNFEKKMFGRISNVFTLNEKDKRLVKNINKDVSCEVILPYFHKDESSTISSNKKYDLVFFGAMNRRENEDGVKWFAKNVYPEIVKKYTNLSVLILGSNPSDSLIKICQKNNFKISGYVDDPYQYIKESAVGIVPLRLGAGIKIKTLEFLGCGIPVVSTSVGAEGIYPPDNSFLFVEDEEISFSNKILELLENPNQRLSAGNKAKKFIEEYYDFDENNKKISDIYNNI